ncbi:tellurite resistance TerB family protein [Cellulophaga tyrosinoxydans]|uniref:DnaJ like chaperone protein n=1 Tax=Cellulophaga tyrosinoxydans TaxID=504486 RepID=A0A1W1YLU2_9FLAO|nr:TerB family tellurite resistance protein [Cellulophaga tyrosinoxydans]SMC37114.1 DnaJ like chaperone protein [Cellulophaga tyrosinoxydans]
MKWIFFILIFYLIQKIFSGTRSVIATQKSGSVSPADFELNLLSLCSVVIKADGKVSQSEMDYVQRYFVSTYGKDKANAIFRTFNEVIKKREISTQRICDYMNLRTRVEVRLQLVHFLFGIAQADGSVSPAEINKIQEIAGYLRIGMQDFESIKAMFIKSADNAYKILEIEKSASDDEVKKAYRTMAKKYHPDRVNNEDEAIKKGAEEKFKEVQIAYETIQKERGIN